jgi:hypothetical protein
MCHGGRKEGDPVHDVEAWADTYATEFARLSPVATVMALRDALDRQLAKSSPKYLVPNYLGD